MEDTVSDNFWRRVWEFGAGFNFVGVVVLVIGHDWVYTRDGLEPPVPGLHYDTWIGIVAVMGIAYFLVSRDLYGNLDLVRISIIAKLVSATPQLVYWLWWPESFATIFLVPMFADYAFAIVYWRFLQHAKRQLPRPA